MVQNKGYAGKILRADLSTGEIRTTPTENYSDRFLGGRGIALKIHWDEVPAEGEATDPENRLVMMTGPVCGVPGFSGSRWQISAKSPYDNFFSYCNLGGSWGAQLKFAGYDGLVVHGKSEKSVYMLIDDDKVELHDATYLKGKGAIETRKILKKELGSAFRVAAVGAAGENRVHFATVTADQDSSGSSGMGAVMGSKNLKAVVVRGSGKVDVAHKNRIQSLRRHIRELKGAPRPWPTMLDMERVKKDMCFGCIKGCIRQTYTDADGQTGKYMCQAAWFYEIRAQRYYGKVTEVPYQAVKMCDDYGLDTRPVETLIMWLSRCFKAGILTEEETGLPLSKMGSLEFIQDLLYKVSFREGFGDILAHGTTRAAEIVGRGSEKLITDYMISTGENDIYRPRLYLTTALFYAMEPRMPIMQLHEISTLATQWASQAVQTKNGYRESDLDLGGESNYMTSEFFRAIAKRFWGSETGADFSTYDYKGAAAASIQNRQNAKESLILCDLSWPIYHTPNTDDHLGDPTLESRICAAVTGLEINEQGLYTIGERVFNLQRAVLVREGQRGRAYDTIGEFNFTLPLKGDVGNPQCLVPGKDGEVFSRMGMVVDRDEFEKMKDEFYSIRGWDVATGLQTRERLEALDLKDVADGLEQQGLVV